jgi:hypothetical protein
MKSRQFESHIDRLTTASQQMRSLQRAGNYLPDLLKQFSSADVW